MCVAEHNYMTERGYPSRAPTSAQDINYVARTLADWLKPGVVTKASWTDTLRDHIRASAFYDPGMPARVDAGNG